MINISAIAEAAAKANDLTKTVTFAERKPLAEGACRLRLRSYLELGIHAGSVKFPTAKPKFRAIFEVVSKKHLEKDHEDKIVHREITVSGNIGTSAKSGDRKLFSAMNASVGNRYNHFAEMIGVGFAAKITNSKPEKEGGAVYSNIDEGPRDASVYTFTPPFKIDEDGEQLTTEDGAPIPVDMPGLRGKPQLFLWEMEGLSDDQILEMWNDIHIEGEWEAKPAEAGKEAKPARSKNVIQEKIMSGQSWEGSRTEGLTQTFVELDELTNEPVVADEPEVAKADPKLEELANMTPDVVADTKAPVADIVDIPGL